MEEMLTWIMHFHLKKGSASLSLRKKKKKQQQTTKNVLAPQRSAFSSCMR